MENSSRDVQREGWDTAAFEKRAADRERAEREVEKEKLRAQKALRNAEHQDGDPFAPTRAWLRKRDYNIEFESRVGTSEIVGSAQAGGFRCKVCDVTVKDSSLFMRHVNSRAHQKALGMSLRVRRSTVEEIQAAFEQAVQRRDAFEKRKQSR